MKITILHIYNKIEETKREIAKNMKKESNDSAKIARITGLSLEDIGNL